MIANIIRGHDAGGLGRYLHGAGEANEHRIYDETGINQIGVGGKVIDGCVMSGKTSPKQWVRLIKDAGKTRSGVRKPVLHIPLAAHKNDRVMTDQEWAMIARDFCEGMGFTSSQPWVAVRHDQKHIHIVAARIDFDGNIWHGRNDRRQAQQVCARIEKKYSLTPAPRRKTSRYVPKEVMRETKRLNRIGADNTGFKQQTSTARESYEKELAQAQGQAKHAQLEVIGWDKVQCPYGQQLAKAGILPDFVKAPRYDPAGKRGLKKLIDQKKWTDQQMAKNRALEQIVHDLGGEKELKDWVDERIGSGIKKAIGRYRSATSQAINQSRQTNLSPTQKRKAEQEKLELALKEGTINRQDIPEIKRIIAQGANVETAIMLNQARTSLKISPQHRAEISQKKTRNDLIDQIKTNTQLRANNPIKPHHTPNQGMHL